MTQTTSFDAFTMWKNVYEKTESTWRDAIQDTLGKESFAESLGQIQSQYLQYQGFLNKITESYLKQANMPSRDEIANIASLVINVESKMDDLEDQMDVNKFDTSKEIEQLKKGLNNLDKKLDKVIELLANSLVSQNTPKVTAGPIITAATNSTNAATNAATSATSAANAKK
ncbi:polyhydroxyalkanoate biosynthesis repressor PhaR [Psychrobacillus sp. OK032]|uniref:polyhydroxyalkanoate biosynthesis repressor PhaR n=1 Tax=Psychrobacillus sp. OK032 TaxID=1884358 RepID=UPI0008B85F0F|nr:polyhydroxyalkanoate biosynthesis repressor PhaR [Psychrobacillus sp. OK032]SES38753.1 polyhydroxyalkanoic acid synthase, PhaR subunit [Psychrobacillus sp. OK032]